MTRFLNLASVEFLLCFPLKWSWSQGCGVRDEDEQRCLPKPSHLGHQHCLSEEQGSLLSPGTLRPQSLSGNHCSTEQDSLCFSQLPLFHYVLKIIKKRRLPFPLTAVVLVKEETDRTGSILKAGPHLGPDCGLWALCPVSIETTYQLENQTPRMEEPQGSDLASPLPKRIP